MDQNITGIINKYSETEQEYYTHCSLFKPVGKYLVNNDNYYKFMKSYCKLISKDGISGIVQRPGSELPILVDVDLHSSVYNDKQYTEEQVLNIIEIYQETIRDVVKDYTNDTLLCCLLEKPMYKDDKNPDNPRYKNGFHLHFPNCFLHKEDIKNYIIPLTKEKIKKKGVFLENQNLDDIIDDAVVKNHWLMYGSQKKHDHKPYKLRKVYNHELCSDSFESLSKCIVYNSNNEIIEFKKDISYYLPFILSIHVSNRKVYHINNNYINYNTVIEKPTRFKHKKKRSIKDIKETLVEVNNLMKIIANWRATRQSEWIQIGWILFNITDESDQGFAIWDNFSQRCPEKYNKEECENYWYSKFKLKNYSIGSLRYYARLDNPTEYRELYKEKERSTLETILEYSSHHDVAKLLQQMVGNTFKCASIKQNIWYQFKNNVWKIVEEGYSLREMISKDVAQSLKELLQNITTECDLTDPDNMAKLKKSQDKVMQLIKQTGNSGFKDGVMKEAKEILYDPLFLDKLDSNPYIVAFKNGVYDFQTNLLREGTPDDFMSKKMKIDFVQYNENDKTLCNVHTFLEQIFPDKSIRKYFLDVYSEVFIGNNHDKKFLVWSGEGNNGKSVTTGIFEKMLGPYSIVLPVSLITGKRGSSAGASPELCRTEGVRMAWLQEPSPQEQINPGIMKELTGNDKFYARGLYKEGRDIKAMFKLALVCNTPPKLESDQASWNRIRILPFESTFTDSAPDNYEEQLKLKQFKMDPDFEDKIPAMVEAFTWLLINHRKNKTKNFKLVEPEKVLQATVDYRSKNDVYKLFMMEQIISKPESIISSQELYEVFKDWFRTSMGNEKLPNKGVVIEEFVRKWGNLDINNCWKGFKIKEIIEYEIDN